MNKQLASLAIVVAMLGTFVFGATSASAQPPETVQLGGAAGLVAAVVQVADVDVEVVEIENSLNNLRALNNVLNNSPILSNNDIDVTFDDVVNIQNVLNDLNVDIDIQEVIDNIGVIVGVALVSVGGVPAGVIIFS